MRRATRSSRSRSPPSAALAVGVPAPVDLGQPVVHGVDQGPLAPGVVQQVILQVRIAVDDPDVAQHLEQHARGAAGAPLAAQRLEERHISAPSSRMTISRSENEV